jgi:hypothetical protein
MPVGYDPACFDLGKINQGLRSFSTGVLQR